MSDQTPAAQTDADARRLDQIHQTVERCVYEPVGPLSTMECRWLVAMCERQRALLAECATVLAHDYEFESPELCPGWDNLGYELRGSFMAKAALSLLEEVRDATR